jgi:glycosyltransferase involved in cell wall biosynthesis
MKLLYFADIRFPMERANGIQTVSTAEALARRGVEVELLVRRTDERSDEACLAFFGLDPHPNLRLNRVATPWGRASYLVAALSRLSSLRRAEGAIVYTRDLVLADLVLRARRLSALPLLYEAHVIASVFAEERARLYEKESRPSASKLRRLDAREERVCRGASGLVTITQALHAALEERHGPLAPARVVPDGARLPASPPALARRDAPLQVYYVGQLYPWKGVDVLVEAMRSVEGAELVVVGGLPPETDLDRLKELATKLDLDDRSRFRGFVPPPELPGETANADLFVIPLLDSETARLYTSPLKLFEAMASGRPIVASDLPSIREILTHEENALLVPPGDAPSLAAAIARLRDDEDLARRLGARAFEHVRAYSWDRRAEAIEEFVRGLSPSGSRGSESSDP